MAQTLIAKGGNWSTAANWGVCNATAESDSEAANTALTTSYVASTTFTPGAITIDGIAVKIASRAASPTGTISIALDQGGSTVVGTEVTINVSDVDTALGWLLVKFTGVALSGATLYSVKAKTSNSTQINLYSTATTNWSRELRTTTTSAAGPAAGDKVIITNEKTGAGTQNTITQTVDSDLSATTIGNTAYPQSVHVSNGGKVAFSTVSAANPKLKVAGIVGIYGGTWNMGNSAGDPIPSNSTAELAFSVTVNVDSGLVANNGSTINLFGYARAATQLKLSQDFGGFAISDHTGAWASLIQGGGNNVVSGYPSGSWDTGAGFANGNAITFTSTAVTSTTFARTLAASNAIRNWASVSISAATNAASAVLTYNGTTAITTGMTMYFSGFTGAWTPCNGWQRVTSVSGNTFSIAINSTSFGALTGSPAFSGSALNVTVALTVDTAFGWLPKGGSAVITVCNLDGTTCDLSDWSTSDQFVAASTGRLGDESELLSVSSVDNSAKTITATGNLSFPHASMAEQGDNHIRCEVINLTRNLKIHGTSNSLQAYIAIAATAVVTSRYVEAYFLGSGTASKRGVDVATTTGTFDWQFGSLHDFVVSASVGLNVSGTSGQTPSTLNISSNVGYNFDQSAIIVAATAGTWTISSNIFIRNNANNNLYNIGDVGGTFTSNTGVASGWAANSASERNFLFSENNQVTGTFTDNISHSSAVNGVSVTVLGGTIGSFWLWRNAGHIFTNSAVGFSSSSVTLSGWVIMGSSVTHVNPSAFFNGVLSSWTMAGDAVFGTTQAILSVLANETYMRLENCTFGVPSVLMVAHVTDINIIANTFAQIVVSNSTLNSPTPVSVAATAVPGTFVALQRLNGVAGNNRLVSPVGITSTDTSIFNLASPSLRLTPSSASSKLPSAPAGYGATAAVNSGGTITVSVYIRRSVVGDGAAYNGNAPRLIVRKNVAAGIAADTVIFTSVGAAGTWEQLSGTTAAVTDDATLEFIVDCDGTAGWINVDDWNFTPAADTKGLKYYSDGIPYVAGDNTSGGLLLNPGMDGGMA